MRTKQIPNAVIGIFTVATFFISIPTAFAMASRSSQVNAMNEITNEAQVNAEMNKASGSHMADNDKDAKILAVLKTADEGEINAAKVAQQKQVPKDVQDFASWMEQEHSKNRDDTDKLAKKLNLTLPDNDKKINKLRSKGQDMLSKISSLDGEQFAKAYMKDMVKDHTEDLDMLDKKIKMAQNDEVKQFLTDTRDTVAKHLERAKQIESSLK